jgi:hypothetical protein
MILKSVLLALIRSYQEDLRDFKSIPRDLKPKLQEKYATVISGIRRCGKSTLAKQILKDKKAYYFLFENVQLANFEQADFSKLNEAFLEEIGEAGIYLLDEVQNISGWEIYVRQLVDSGKIVVVTGSNATMLSRELGTRLTGRHLRYELYPFSFAEYLELTKSKAGLSAFENYFNEGGFPEYLKIKDNDLLSNLFQDIFYRDILVRNDFRSEPELKQFIAFLSSNIGVEISYNKLKKILGLGSVTTVSQFIAACESAYLFFEISKFDFSVKKQIVNPKKIYCVDNGLLRLNSFSFSENKGRYLENIVFISLKRQNKEIYYHKSKHECDFVIRQGLKIAQAIQVCYDFNEETKDRELNGLVDACKEYKLGEGLILTYNQQDVLVKDSINIKIMPVWKWLLER